MESIAMMTQSLESSGDLAQHARRVVAEHTRPRSTRLTMMIPLTTSLVLLVNTNGRSGDWPQILGPHRNGVAHSERIVEALPAGGPATVWQKRVGQGFAGPAASGNNVIIFHRRGSDNIVWSLDARTGRENWNYSYPTDYASSISSDSGPRCVPLITASAVYVHGPEGMLICLSLRDGNVVWSRDTSAEFGFAEGYFGQGSSPIVAGDNLVVNVGGRNGAGIVAFDLKSGETKWKSTNEQASYSSPVHATIDGVHHLLFATRLNSVSLNPADGRVQFRIPFGKRGPTVNAASPIVLDNHIFLTASYGIGAVLLKVDGDDTEVVWRNQRPLSSQYITPVPSDGVLYGIDGRDDLGLCHLRALDPLTGSVHWSNDDFGMSSIILADGKLLCLKSDGEFVIVRAIKDGYDELSRARVFTSTTRALPALANGLFYARDTRSLKCFDLRRP